MQKEQARDLLELLVRGIAICKPFVLKGFLSREALLGVLHEQMLDKVLGEIRDLIPAFIIEVVL